MYNSAMASENIVTDKFLERLNGLVPGKKRTYRFELTRGTTDNEFDELFDIIITDNATGEIVNSSVFRKNRKIGPQT